MSDEAPHRPVMAEEALAFLRPRPGGVYCDATVGYGGHAEAILRAAGDDAWLIGIDLDPQALAYSRQRLAGRGGRVDLLHGNFADLAALLAPLGSPRLDGIIWDLGVSSPQLEPGRGFSFRANDPLDCRMDPSSAVTAATLVNTLAEDELTRLIKEYGDERYAHRIARALVERRKHRPIESTEDLKQVVLRAYPARRRHGRIHCASRTFLALRIAVNREFENLADGLQAGVAQLAAGGRGVVLSYHSGEDRIAKRLLRSWSGQESGDGVEAQGARGGITVLTPRPLTPRADEIAANRRARSCKLRAFERRDETWSW